MTAAGTADETAKCSEKGGEVKWSSELQCSSLILPAHKRRSFLLSAEPCLFPTPGLERGSVMKKSTAAGGKFETGS